MGAPDVFHPPPLSHRHSRLRYVCPVDQDLVSDLFARQYGDPYEGLVDHIGALVSEKDIFLAYGLVT
jgi:hypothetical protein